VPERETGAGRPRQAKFRRAEGAEGGAGGFRAVPGTTFVAEFALAEFPRPATVSVASTLRVWAALPPFVVDSTARVAAFTTRADRRAA
jgi:hypothetical protein